jgi:hypothetical protein
METAKSTANPDPQAVDLALKRYGEVFRYLIYENTVYWTRSQFFLIANAGLLGFVTAKLPFSFREFAYSQAAALAVACLGGMYLTWLWSRALSTGEHWISRWETICISFESEAFGSTEVLRNGRLGKPDSAKRVAHRCVALFVALWILAATYLAAMMILKHTCLAAS